MLRPEKGEGERQNTNKRRFTTKGPLLFTAALIFATPLCLAQSAMASTYETSSFGLLQSPNPAQTALRSQLSNQPKSYLNLRLLSSSAPSASNIDNLESTLSGYKTQLETLKTSAKTKPSQELETAIKSLENRILVLENKITKAKNLQKSYETAVLQVKTATKKYNNSVQAKKDAEEAYKAAQIAYNAAKEDLTTRTTTLTTTQSNLAAASAALTAAEEDLTNADAAVTQQQSVKQQAQTNLDNKKSAAIMTASNLSTAEQALTQATTATASKQAALNSAQQELTTAQNNYNNNLIPDPTWTAPTYQKEHTRQVENTRTVEVRTQVPTTTTTLQEQVIPNLLFNSDFSRGTEGWSGVNAGWQGSNPALIDGEIIFSYQNQTVSQGLFSGPFQNATLTLSADWFNNDSNTGRVDNYSMTVEAKDINQNTVGSATYNSTGAHNWENKSVTLTATGPVSYITVSFTGVDSGFWYGVYGPHVKNPVLQVSHGQMVTETTYEEVITYEEETYYTYETYYTTELVKTEGTLNVKINEGGQATFNAPAGATFISSNLRYEAIARPTCGKDIAPQLTGLSTITIQALNSVWGDPCGGWQKHITGTLTYLGQPTAPLINDASLLPILQEKQAALDVAQQAKDTAQEVYDDKLFIKQLANNDLTSSRETFNEALASRSAAESQVSEAMAAYNEAVAAKEIAQASYDAALTSKQVASSTVETATTNQEAVVAEVTAAETSYEQVSTNYTASTQALAETEEKVVVATKKEASTLEVANKTYTEASKKSNYYIKRSRICSRRRLN